MNDAFKSSIRFHDGDGSSFEGQGMEQSLGLKDPKIFEIINLEKKRQKHQIELIASENIVSKAVLEAQGSILTNKYAEGYPGRRYYGGCAFVDQVEEIAQQRIQELFSCRFSNVQPHSGSQANQAVFLALMSPGDTFLGMDLSSGGHLTHGSAVNLSGKWFHAESYGVDASTHMISYEDVREKAQKVRPKIIIAGGSAYPRKIDFKVFREIADEVGAYLLVDIAHTAGLVVTGKYPSPFPHAHVVTSTTHKTLRGPRGGVILTNDPEISKKVNSAVFPGLQGGPLMHVIAAKAVAFGEALEESFNKYAQRVCDNAKRMAGVFLENDIQLVTGGTDSHLLLLDLTKYGVSGAQLEESLEKIGIATNKNTIPNDPLSPRVTSGLRIGTPAISTRGMGGDVVDEIATIISEVIKALSKNKEINEELVTSFSERVDLISMKYPIYGD